MNIFVLDTDPVKAAQYHCDKHVVKMILETAQLLCSVHHATEAEYDIPYKATHINHPCAKWARESTGNYYWLQSLGDALCQEYTYRYGKVHKSQAVIDWAFLNEPDIPEGDMTPFAHAVDDDLKELSPTVDVYRGYYHRKSWDMDMRYTKRNKPCFVS